MSFFQSVSDLVKDQETVRRRAYGVIETAAGQLVRIGFRPWPKTVSIFEIMSFGLRSHYHKNDDRCRLYFNQPLFHRSFLALPYIHTTAGTSYATFRKAINTLDQIAYIKRSNAIVCEVTYDRISDRALKRWGWESHLPNSKRRHYIKRFYGDYPDHAVVQSKFEIAVMESLGPQSKALEHRADSTESALQHELVATTNDDLSNG